jgi:hypothetical protein
VIRRLKVLGISVLLAAAFSLWVAGPMMPSGMGAADRVFVWASVMGGPVVGTAWGTAPFYPVVFSLGWLGLVFIAAHPIRPGVMTACVTLLGLALWLFAGFLTMMDAAWGA